MPKRTKKPSRDKSGKKQVNPLRKIVATLLLALSIVSSLLLVTAAYVEYLSPEVHSLPALLGLSAVNDEKLVYEAARVTAIEAKKEGVNVAWGPVVDLSKAGSVNKNSRCFGDEAGFVSLYANEMIRGFHDEGMIVTAKHFPGGQDVLIDTHMEKGISNLTEEELLKNDIIPYLNAMEEVNLSGIMTGHVLFKNIDGEYIASLSKKVIDITRKIINMILPIIMFNIVKLIYRIIMS